MNINKEVYDARKNLRLLYIKYTEELFTACKKIDYFLQSLEIKEEQENE